MAICFILGPSIFTLHCKQHANIGVPPNPKMLAIHYLIRKVQNMVLPSARVGGGDEAMQLDLTRNNKYNRHKFRII